MKGAEKLKENHRGWKSDGQTNDLVLDWTAGRQSCVAGITTLYYLSSGQGLAVSVGRRAKAQICFALYVGKGSSSKLLVVEARVSPYFMTLLWHTIHPTKSAYIGDRPSVQTYSKCSFRCF